MAPLIPKMMDALVMQDFHKFDIEQVPVPTPGFGEVLCAVDSVCIGGTDPEILEGRGERMAKAFGAEIVDNTKIDGVQGVWDLTGGRGADLTVDCAARGQTPREAVGMTRMGGRVVLTGVPLEEVALPLQRIVPEEMDVFGGRANRGTCEETIALIAAGKTNAKALIAHRFPLRGFRKAYEVFTKCVDGPSRRSFNPPRSSGHHATRESKIP